MPRTSAALTLPGSVSPRKSHSATPANGRDLGRGSYLPGSLGKPWHPLAALLRRLTSRLVWPHELAMLNGQLESMVVISYGQRCLILTASTHALECEGKLDYSSSTIKTGRGPSFPRNCSAAHIVISLLHHLLPHVSKCCRRPHLLCLGLLW